MENQRGLSIAREKNKETPKEGSWNIALELYKEKRITLEMACWCLKHSGHSRDEVEQWLEIIEREGKMNSVKCEDCKFGVEVNPNTRALLCDNPNLKTYGKNIKHGRTFSCGKGEANDEQGD